MNAHERYRDYLKTDYWQEVSRMVKKRAGYRCQLCNSPHDLIAHHRTYDHRGAELQHLDDLVCLCQRCHAVFHGKITLPAAPEAPVPAKRGRKGTPTLVMEAEKVMEYVKTHLPPGGGELLTITRAMVQACRTDGNAFTNESLRHFGLTKPLISGWPSRLVGKQISRDGYRKALEGRFCYGSGPLPSAEKAA